MQTEFYQAVAAILKTARSNAYRAINFAMVEAYWEIGRIIVDEEQKGKERAGYGDYLIRNLSIRLTRDFGRGFTETNLRNFRQFFLAFPFQDTGEIRYALRSELSWTHYRALMRLEKPDARRYYMKEAAEQNWSSRALERQINSLYYERLVLSREREPVEAEARNATASLVARPEDFIKDPYVLEFLNIEDNASYRESELEQAIIQQLQAFMLELGRGFAFVARQKRVSTETMDFYVDLVFYNYILKAFVLIDLQIGPLTPQDIGQMDLYIRLFEDTVKGDGDNPTIGIILCSAKDQTVVKYSVLNESRQLFASKYTLYLPTEEELRQELDREKAAITSKIKTKK
ncbi:MAG: PDDEXK nuclease domain-containing protein [Desulfomonilaceae bacterium]